MIEVVYYVACSMDGFISLPDGSVDWLTRYEKDEEVASEFPDFEESIDAIAIGSKTYEFMLNFPEWPHPGKTCWVFTTRRLERFSHDIVFTQSTPQQVVAEAQAKGLRRMWLIGGGHLAAQFRRAGLITEYVISYVPIILGEGIPLFAPGPYRTMLSPIEVKQFKCGLVQIRMR
ncbi:MAG: dihydrofolate reductase family protein [Candidatus Methylacidiphilales bacterium]|nr:dihydrofolate reductase family protein [Candidatus Methylacidiphilales bacterium]